METNQKYPVHPLARLFPPLTTEQYAALVASIMAIGLLDPIIVWQGQIIDGLHRQRACREAGVQPRYELLDDDADPVQYVIAKNGTRRDMDESQRAVVAHELSRWSAPGRPREDDKNCSDVNSFTQVQAAQALRVGRTMVSYARRVLSDDGPAVPELRQAVKGWRLTVSDATKVAKKPPEIQRRALGLLEEGKAKTITRAVRQVEREIADAEEAEVRESILTLALGDTVTLHTATVTSLQTLVPPASVDAIITQPPEPRESLPIFSDLAVFAAHALKPGGVLVIVASGMFLPWILKNLQHDQLQWMAELDLLYRGQPGNSGTPAVHAAPPPAGAGLQQGGVPDERNARPVRGPAPGGTAGWTERAGDGDGPAGGTVCQAGADGLRSGDAGPGRNGPGLPPPRLHLRWL